MSQRLKKLDPWVAVELFFMLLACGFLAAVVGVSFLSEICQWESALMNFESTASDTQSMRKWYVMLLVLSMRIVWLLWDQLYVEQEDSDL